MCLPGAAGGEVVATWSAESTTLRWRLAMPTIRPSRRNNSLMVRSPLSMGSVSAVSLTVVDGYGVSLVTTSLTTASPWISSDFGSTTTSTSKLNTSGGISTRMRPVTPVRWSKYWSSPTETSNGTRATTTGGAFSSGYAS